MNRIISFSAILPLVISLLGCNTSIVKPGPGDNASLPEGQGWWHARFLFPYSADAEPEWQLGTLIGGEVIAPLLDQYKEEIPLWRIHRRASTDELGHAFSFIFFSTASVAQGVYNSIEGNAAVGHLKSISRLKQVKYDDLATVSKPNISDTSDSDWPDSIQTSWPSYIMGVSQLWLSLVADIKSNHSDSDTLEDQYTAVQEELSAIWTKEGQHALFHHLNAVFAYQPLLIRH